MNSTIHRIKFFSRVKIVNIHNDLLVKYVRQLRLFLSIKSFCNRKIHNENNFKKFSLWEIRKNK